MKAPVFWRREANPLPGLLLSPLGWIYGFGTNLRRMFKSGVSYPVPVICVGNLVAGGAGKTPVVMDIAGRLEAAHVLSRGYGGSESGPLKVSTRDHDAVQVGDEPLLIAGVSTVWVCDDRQIGCQAALGDGAQTIILDDGFQDPSVKKDLSVIVVDGGYGFGNGHCIPAGPLRESIDSGLGRADAVVIIGDDTSGILKQVAGYGPVLHARLVPRTPEHWQGRKVVAFAGIGRPEKFFQSLEKLDCKISESIAFADHHPFTVQELGDLKQCAEMHGASLVTTQKDIVRIPENHRSGIETLTVDLQWDDVSQIETLLDKHITR